MMRGQLSSRSLAWFGATASALILLVGLSVMLDVRRASVPGVGLLAVGCLGGLASILSPAARTGRAESRPAPGRPVWGARLGVAAAGSAMIGGLLLTLAAPGSEPAGNVLTLAGVTSAGMLTAPGVFAALRRIAWRTFAAGLILLAVAAAVIALGARLASSELWLLPVPFVVAAVGSLLLADAFGTGQRPGDSERSAWGLISGRGRGRRGSLWRGVAGGLLVLGATGLGLAMTESRVSGHPLVVTLSAAAVTLAAAVVIGTPLLVTTLIGRQRLATERMRAAERARVAAHLHDSVLQTLALVQRQAADPAAVTLLARRQEQSLRNWMAGQDEPAPGTLAAALGAVVVEVEDAAGVSVELSMVGDRPTEARDEALLAATREALRNAVHHARGSPVTVYAEVMDDLVEVFVCDEGPGFVLDEVPDTRRGVRDAILARMQAVGGSAEVVAQPGHGTEVQLRLPRI